MVSSPTVAAVSASISTPVRSIVSATTSITTALSGSSSVKTTATCVRGNGCASGISSAVRLAAWIAAMRAVPSTSPFCAEPARISASVSGRIAIRPPARASRRVISLPATSTMCACPAASKWVKCERCPAIARSPPSCLSQKLSANRGHHSTMSLTSPVTRTPRRSLTAMVAWIAVSLAVTPLSFAQQNLPELGDPSATFLSGVQERKLGESVMRQIRGSGGYLNDPEVNGYLNELGNRLVTAIPGAPFDFEFFAMADSSINAFALPGGFVGVNTGLVLLAQSESELASVLGHEITHVTQHHIARGIGNQRDALLMALGALAAAVLASRSHSSSSGDMTQGAIAAAHGLAIQSQINFTRPNAEEADRLGFERT